MVAALLRYGITVLLNRVFRKDGKLCGHAGAGFLVGVKVSCHFYSPALFGFELVEEGGDVVEGGGGDKLVVDGTAIAGLTFGNHDVGFDSFGLEATGQNAPSREDE
jgi:hypothetical protein